MKLEMSLLIIFVLAHFTFGQNYTLEDTKTFKPQEKKVLLFSKDSQPRKFILYYSKLRVNTDGSPKSYHPDDFDGTSKAINSTCNGIGVYKKLPNNKEEKVKKCSEAKEIFRQFRANNWNDLPGYRINWQDVLAARDSKPCIFQDGLFKGYFGSLTSVKNALPILQRGECEYKNQLDALEIPNIVLPAEKWKDSSGVVHINPLQEFKADKEDLVFAYNQDTNIWSYAIIGDGGPNDNLGEGSVYLNMNLQNKTVPPKNYTEARKLDTGNKKIFVAIIPNSKGDIVKPFTQENIKSRGNELLKEMGFNNEESFIKFLIQQKSKF